MKIEPIVWICSTNEENWYADWAYGSRAEAAAAYPEAEGLEPGEVFFTGLKRQVTLDDLNLDVAPWPATTLSENLCDHKFGGGEWSENWPDFDEGDEAELVEKIATVTKKWLEKHSMQPTWFTVLEVERHVVPDVK